MNMSPKFVRLESFNVLGFRYFGKNENNEISDLWTKFHLEIKKYKEFINKDKIGLCSKANINGDFEYICGIILNEEEKIDLKNMVSKKVISNDYIVFKHVGKVEKLDKTYEEIKKWFINSKVNFDDDYDFEYYGKGYKNDEDDSVIYIYYPIKNEDVLD
ncbi:MAG: AraC family transcriptional regulator [Oceanotoga sp.]|uniref:GyrI-like domain-containing protein n=1 Tax=Oceanotoga sp. TaxID=2108366 RepID=UPI00264DDEE8|nr:GyrI-like domain-containing protein [Oceanotoga sp.]MDN5341953.1 AraC family transcriptional regulator [Oceanotoga sp.]